MDAYPKFLSLGQVHFCKNHFDQDSGMISSLSGRLVVIFNTFSLLVVISIAATTWVVDIQKKNTLVINLAGRQRMLVS